MTDKKKPTNKQSIPNSTGIDTANIAVSLHLVIKDETSGKIILNQRG